MIGNYYTYKILSGITENELLKLLNKRYPNIKKIEDEFSSIDCFDSSTEIHYELKCRYEHYPTMYIEKEKYLALLDKGNSYYVTSTPKGIYMFHIQSMEEPIWRTKYLPHTTEFSDTNWIEKEIGEIRVDKGMEITQLLL